MRLFLLLVLSLFQLTTTAAEVVGEFEEVKMKTFDGEKFKFPSAMQGKTINLMFLGMSDSQENGEWQQERLIEWHEALSARLVFDDAVMPYHFPAMSSPPFFVKGMIARAMGEEYENTVPMDQAGVLYLDDLEEFATAAGLVADGQPTIVIADPAGKPLQAFKGEATEENVAAVLAAVAAIAPDSVIQAPGGEAEVAEEPVAEDAAEQAG